MGGLIAVWILFITSPYAYAVLISIAFPLLVIIIVFFFKGLIRIDGLNESAHPLVFIAVFLPSFGLAIRALLDYEIFDYSKVWMPIFGMALTLVLFLIVGTKQFQFDKARDFFTTFSLFVFSVAYSYGALITLNCYFDETVPKTYQVKVIGKRISGRKTTNYYLNLSPWGERTKNEEVSVSKELFNKTSAKENVTVCLNKGRFDIPWILVQE